MLIERVYDIAKKDLEGLYIKDVVIGISFLGVQLSDDNLAFTYLMREDLPSGCSIFPYGQEMIGMKAVDCAEWAVTGKEDVQRGLGCAVLNAASKALRSPATKGDKDFMYQGIRPEDTIGVIGHMPPLVQNIAPRVKKYISFDRAIDMSGSVDNVSIYPVARQAELLPQCDIVYISGTSMINHTSDQIIRMATGAREIYLIGFSLPFYPPAYEDSGLTAITCVEFKPESKEVLFKEVSRGCGRLTMHEYTHGHIYNF